MAAPTGETCPPPPPPGPPPPPPPAGDVASPAAAVDTADLIRSTSADFSRSDALNERRRAAPSDATGDVRERRSKTDEDAGEIEPATESRYAAEAEAETSPNGESIWLWL